MMLAAAMAGGAPARESHSSRRVRLPERLCRYGGNTGAWLVGCSDCDDNFT